MPSYLKIDPHMTPQELRQQAYREKYKASEPAWEDSVMRLARLFREHAAPDMTVLDAGCGRANYVLESNSASLRRVIGVDASKEATEGNTLADPIVVADLEALPFEDGLFDAVTSLWVLEHVRSPERVFREIRRVLKPGGKFFFVTPYAFSYVLLAKRLLGGRFTSFVLAKLYGRTEDDTFRTEYAANTARDLRRLLAEAGMRELTLIENPDPSYLAFGPFFYRLALLIQRLASLLGLKIATMHLVGVFEKPEDSESGRSLD